MNRKLASALVLAAAAMGGNAFAGNAFAGDITIDTTPFVSTASRADVQAQVTSSRQAGTSPWSMQYNPLAGFKGEKSRDQVSAEYVASRNQVAAFNSEDSGSAYLAQTRVRAAGTSLAGQPQRNAQ